MNKMQSMSKIPGLPKAPKETYLNELAKYSKAELLELRDRQSKLLANK